VAPGVGFEDLPIELRSFSGLELEPATVAAVSQKIASALHLSPLTETPPDFHQPVFVVDTTLLQDVKRALSSMNVGETLWLAGHPGTGKTTAVALSARALGLEVRWVRGGSARMDRELSKIRRDTRATSSSQVLVVLDDVARPAEVREQLEQLRSVRSVVTTREAPEYLVPSSRLIVAGELSSAEAAEMLSRLLPAGAVARALDEVDEFGPLTPALIQAFADAYREGADASDALRVDDMSRLDSRILEVLAWAPRVALPIDMLVDPLGGRYLLGDVPRSIDRLFKRGRVIRYGAKVALRSPKAIESATSWQSIEVIRNGLIRMRHEVWEDSLDPENLRKLTISVLDKARTSNSTRVKGSAVRLAIASAQALRAHPVTAVEIVRLAQFLLSGSRGKHVELDIELSEALSSALTEAGEQDLALDAARSALELSELHLGQNDPRSVSMRFLVARFARSAGALEEAQSMLEESLDLGQHLVPELDPARIEVRLELARVLAQRGRLHEAEAQYAIAVELSTRALGVAHPVTMASRLELADVLAGLGASARATRQVALGDGTPTWEGGP
jgi:tetratricopeptide (TPR) repeat protein